MVQLKQVQIRLKSIKNIQKITKTMKMVSASKFTRSERELAAARPFGYAPRKFYESSRLVLGKVDDPPKKGEKGAETPAPKVDPAAPAVAAGKEADLKKKRIYIAVTSDRGLCGGVHSGVARRMKREMSARKAEDSEVNKILCIGDKSRSMMARTYPKHMIVSVKDIGRNVPVFADASAMAAAIAHAKYQYDLGEIYYNKYFSPIKYELTIVPFFSKSIIETAPNLTAFDDIEDDLESYSEWTVAALIYYALKENSASELSARMSAMDNATKNASEMIRKLTLLFNRTRQAVITRELIEIISGAAALE